jgi:hypothetical protein
LCCFALQAGFNKPLLPPKSEDVDILSHQQEQADLEKMKMFVQLRQDLERVSITQVCCQFIVCSSFLQELVYPQKKENQKDSFEVELLM